MQRLLKRIAGACLCVFAFSAAQAQMWDPNFGADTGLMEDDGEINMTLGFMFPFAGTNYDTVAINTNGGVTLGIGGVFAGDSYVDYDIWDVAYFESDFTAVGNPIFLPFNSDLDNGSGVGTIHFKTDANTAVITWSGIASFEDDSTPLISFQLQLNVDGTFAFAYEAVTGTGDLTVDLDQGIVIGVSDGLGAPPPASSDMSAAVNADVTSMTVYEIWCYDEIMVGGDCYDQTGRPDNNGFDMAAQSGVLFTPNATGGFDTSNMAAPPPPPPPPNQRIVLRDGGCTVGSADGTIDPTLPLLVLVSLVYLLRRRMHGT